MVIFQQSISYPKNIKTVQNTRKAHHKRAVAAGMCSAPLETARYQDYYPLPLFVHTYRAFVHGGKVFLIRGQKHRIKGTY